MAAAAAEWGALAAAAAAGAGAGAAGAEPLPVIKLQLNRSFNKRQPTFDLKFLLF